MNNLEERRNFAHGEIHVLWDIVDFPVPKGEIDLFYRSVISSLRNGGYFGRHRIRAYGHREDPKELELESVHPEIILLRRSSRYARVTSILLDMLDSTRMSLPPANFMLIMKGMAEEDTEVVYAIKEMRKLNYNVLLVAAGEEDYYAYPSEVRSSCTVWLWKSLVNGGCPIRPTTTSDSEDDSEDDDSDTSSDEGSSSHKRQKKMIDAASASSVCAF